MNLIKNFSALLITAVIFTSCTKKEGPLSDIKPDIPVSVSNAMDFRPEPTVSTTLAATDSIITINLSIPANSGRTIASVKVATSTSYTQIQSSGTTGFYTNAIPVAISGTNAVFKSSIREYFVNKPVSASNLAAQANRELSNRFYFLITLDDGTVLIPQPVRVLVL